MDTEALSLWWIHALRGIDSQDTSVMQFGPLDISVITFSHVTIQLDSLSCVTCPWWVCTSVKCISFGASNAFAT